jgi:Ca-activated chloride channel family protein
MNRTTGIFIAAALIAAVAAALAFNQPPPTPEDPPHPPAQAGGVTLQTQLSNAYLLHGGTREVYLDVGIKGAREAAEHRLPLNLALVIDRSGSMAGEKLEHARQAARTLIQRLRTGDRIAIVTYGSDVTTLVPSVLVNDLSRRRLLAAVARITDRGGTFLSGGLAAGRAQVEAHIADDRVNRVILISDGQANEGVTDQRSLARLARDAATAGVSVTTMGVGLDFAEDVMTAMAETGAGHYYFIRDADALAGIFSKELEVMLATVARRPQLEVALADGVELAEVYGYEYRQQGNIVRVQLPAIYGGQDRKVVLRLRVASERLGSRSVAKTRLVFSDSAGERQTVAQSAMGRVSDDPAVVSRGVNPTVIARVEQAQAASAMNEAMTAYGDGDIAAARGRLKQQIRRTSRLNKDLKRPELDRVVRTLKKQLETAAEAAPASPTGRALIKRSKAKAYGLAK